jgi:SAM-dependent methyltransferase
MMEHKVSSAWELAMLAEGFGYRSFSRYRARATFLFDGIDLHGARVLDVGCGSGAFSVWCGLQGASSVVGLEPEADGSSPGSRRRFSDLAARLHLRNVEIRNCILEKLCDEVDYSGRFSLCLMYNVINHLNEHAVVSLHSDEESRKRYREMLSGLHALLQPGGWLIVADCGRRNLWNKLGLKSPFAPNIEWHKHQEPNIWIQVLRESGFVFEDLRWAYSYPFVQWTANRLCNYVTRSDFVLRVRAVK